MELDNSWVSPSRTRNYILGDPLLDWLDLYGDAHGYKRDDDSCFDYLPEADFSKFVMSKGQEFEAAVLEYLSTKLGITIQRIASNGKDTHDREMVDHTVEALKSGVDAVYQGVLWDPIRKTYGAPDLLMRSDVVARIAPGTEISNAGAVASNIGQPHYVVVDIKYSTIHLNAQGEVNNDGSAPAYKAQIALYNAALSDLQGFDPKAGYLLGRAVEDNRGVSMPAFGPDGVLGRFTIVQPQWRADDINWLLKATEALSWIRRARAEGENWEVCPKPSVPELYPNMKYTMDAPWHRAKSQIGKEIGEITSLWQIGLDMRQKMHAIGVTSTKHPDCTVAKLANVPGSRIMSRSGLNVYGQRLTPMLEANSPDCPHVVLPAEKLTEMRNEWGEPRTVEFFVDFETVSDLDDDFEKLPNKNGLALITMVGCGHFENGEWQFKVFTAQSLTADAEKEILSGWIKHMESVRLRLDPACRQPVIYHWSPAETVTFISGLKAARTRHGEIGGAEWLWPAAQDDKYWPPFFDFLEKVGKPSKLAVRGGMGFGLKSIAKSMHAQGLIETVWGDGPTDGLGAMTGTWWCYGEAAKKKIDVRDVVTPERNGNPGRQLMLEIERYNEVDCKVMAEVISWLRQNR